MRKAKEWKGICVHHSLTEDSKTLSWDAIRDYHVNVNGWDDIGYQLGIELVGDEVVALPGRPLEYRGAHCPGLNATHIGVCVVGNYDKEEPSDAHIEKLVEACAGLCLIFGLDPENIEYHSDHSHKTCPGSKFISRETLIELVKERL